MDIYSVTQELIATQPAYTAQYADGVFIRLTGGMVHDFQHPAKRDGYMDANTMTRTEAASWLAYCVNTLGYVYNGKAVTA